MKVITLTVGPIMENCYILYDENTLDGIIVDPGAEANRILATVAKLHLNIKYIVNTHGHADHIGANREIGEALHCKLAIHQDDEPMLASPDVNLSSSGYMGKLITSQSADILLKENDIIEFGNCQLKVLHTPGHTPGGICLVGEGVVMSGDTLFAGSVGRTDLPGGSMRQLITAIRTKLMPLNPDLKVYPGHGPSSTIGEECQSNPYLR